LTDVGPLACWLEGKNRKGYDLTGVAGARTFIPRKAPHAAAQQQGSQRYRDDNLEREGSVTSVRSTHEQSTEGARPPEGKPVSGAGLGQQSRDLTLAGPQECRNPRIGRILGPEGFQGREVPRNQTACSNEAHAKRSHGKRRSRQDQRSQDLDRSQDLGGPGTQRRSRTQAKVMDLDNEGWHYIDLEDLLGFDSS
jgi:hypothetical protein